MTTADRSTKQILDEINSLVQQERAHYEKTLSNALSKLGNDHVKYRSDDFEKMQRLEAEIESLRKSYDEMITRANRVGISQPLEPANAEIEFRNNSFLDYIRKGKDELSHEQIRALGTADSDGGFFVPPDYETLIQTKAYELAEIRPKAFVATTGRDLVKIPKMSQVVMTWATTGLETIKQDLGSGQENLHIWQLRGLVRISNDTLEDPESDLVGQLSDSFPRAIAQAEDAAFASGTGADMPLGIFTDPRVRANVTESDVSGKLTDTNNNGIDKLLEMMYKLKATYRMNATWMFNSLTEAELRKLKDSDGRYLWQPPVQAGEPSTLLGMPTIATESADDIGSGKFPIAIGDIQTGFHIRDRSGYSIIRDQSVYRSYDETGFFLKSRVGGQVVLPEAFQIMQITV